MNQKNISDIEMILMNLNGKTINLDNLREETMIKK